MGPYFRYFVTFLISHRIYSQVQNCSPSLDYHTPILCEHFCISKKKIDKILKVGTSWMKKWKHRQFVHFTEIFETSNFWLMISSPGRFSINFRTAPGSKNFYFVTNLRISQMSVGLMSTIDDNFTRKPFSHFAIENSACQLWRFFHFYLNFRRDCDTKMLIFGWEKSLKLNFTGYRMVVKDKWK